MVGHRNRGGFSGSHRTMALCVAAVYLERVEPGTPFMSESHSLDLIVEAVAASKRACATKQPPMLQNLGIGQGAAQSHRVTQSLNRVAHLIGLHVSRLSVIRQAAQAATEAVQTAISAYQSLWYDGVGATVGMGTLLAVLEDPQAFDDVYSNLADDRSRRTFDWFIRFRVAYALAGEDAYSMFPAEESRASYAARCAALANAPGGGFAVGSWTIESDAGVIVDSLVLEQYCLPGVVEPGPGWITLDVGAYKGETAIWLADRSGRDGAVYAFEPDPSVAGTLTANIERNRSAGQSRICVVPYGVGATPGKQSFAGVVGGASHVDDTGDMTIDVTTIDRAVDELRVDHVDFIKMDIEGGEVDALRGAKETLRRFSPRLAISVYHRPNDLPDIARKILETRPDYSLYLSHKSPNWDETVLFACVPTGNGSRSQ
jgi:FkbM family methyltransferase